MTDFDDDLFEGEGFPTQDQILAVRGYLRRHNRIHSGLVPGDERGVRPTFKELKARGFQMSLSTVQRVLIAADLGEPVRDQQADHKGPGADILSIRRSQSKASKKDPKDPKPKESNLTLENLRLTDRRIVPTVARLLKREATSTSLAIHENRVRMALNIIIAERMCQSPDLMMLDMKGTAALVDALTVASKLSGGASIDIHIPTVAEIRAQKAMANGANGTNGHAPMKDVTPIAPKSALAQDFEAYRKKRADGGKAS